MYRMQNNDISDLRLFARRLWSRMNYIENETATFLNNPNDNSAWHSKHHVNLHKSARLMPEPQIQCYQSAERFLQAHNPRHILSSLKFLSLTCNYELHQ